MQPIRALADEHRLIRSASRLLEGAVERIGRGDAAALPAARDLLEFFWFFADRLHQGKEEDLLIPALEAAGVAPEGGPTTVTLAEHAEERALLQMAWHGARHGLEEPADRQAFAEACHRFVALLEAHLEAEEEGLFALAEKVLGERQRAELTEAFRVHGEREAGQHERCRALLARARGTLQQGPQTRNRETTEAAG